MRTGRICVGVLTVVLLMMFPCLVTAFEGYIGITNGYFYDQASGEPWVPHGIAYQTWNRPLGVWQTYEQIDYDLDEMVKMGANSVRIDIVWQHAEEEGDDIFSWDNYDYFVSACEERDIRIFALVGYQWPPNWFPDEWYTKHPPELDSEGIEHTNRWQSDIINYEHPEARAQYSNWVYQVCSRYATNKAIVGWVVGNEYGYLGLWSGLPDGYDDETEQAFRTWCSNKYSTIEQLNAAWGSDYADFESIDFIEQYRAYGPPGAQWAAMVQFREDSIAEFTAASAAAAKAADKNHLISYSTVGMQWGEEDWRYHAEDRGKITKEAAALGAAIDFFSVNNYPWSILGHESQNGQWGVSYTKKVAKVPVLYSETGFSSSETMWPHMDIFRQGQLIDNAMWESLEAGAIGTHIFSWMDRPYITEREKGFGILYADRRVKPAFWENRNTFTLMDQVNLQDLLMASEDPTPDIAFLWTAANDSQYNRYECEMQQIAGALERLGYEPNFMNLEDLSNHDYTNFSVLILPRNMRVESEVPGAGMGVVDFIISNVIPAGVHVIASADLPGMQDEYGKENSDFEAKLDHLFGIDASDIGGYEFPNRRREFISWYWAPIDVQFTSNAVSPLGSSYTYSPQTWKYNDEVEVTDGELWATMDTRRNRGFETCNTNADEWYTWGETHVRNGWGWAYEGSNMVQMWDEAGLWMQWDIVPYGRYSHSHYLRSNADDPLRGGNYGIVQLEFRDKDDNLMKVVSSAPLVGYTPDNAWVKYTADGLAPAGGGAQLSEPQPWKARRVTRLNTAATNLLSNGAMAGSGSAPTSWSDWNSGSHDPETAIAHSGSDSWKFWWDGGIYQDIISGFAVGDVLRVGGWFYTEAGGGSVESLSNAGFEDDSSGTSPPSNWSKSGSGNIWCEIQAFADGGTKVTKSYQGWANQTQVLYQALSASEDDEFVASAKVYDWSASGNPMESGDKAFVVIQWKNSGGTDIGNAVTSAVVTSSSGQDTWHTLSVTGTAPANAASARVVLALAAGANNNVQVYWDTVSLTLQNPSSGDPLRDGTKYGVVQVEFYDADDTKLSTVSADPTISKDSAKGVWICTEGDFTVPTDAVKARVVVRCNDHSSGDGSFFVDDLYAYNVNHYPNLLANGELDGSGDAPTSWNSWNNGSHDPETESYRSGDNSWVFWWDGGIYQDVTNCIFGEEDLVFGGFLYTPGGSADSPALSNASFEADGSGTTPPSYWTKSGNGNAWCEIQAFADDGSKVAKIFQGWANQAQTIYQEISASENDQLVASAKVYDWSLSGNPMESGDQAYIVLEWKNSGGTDLGNAVTSAVVTASSGQDTWHALAVTGTAPANAASARLVLTMAAGGNNNVQTYWDTTGISLQNTADPLRDGTKYGVIQVEFYEDSTKLSTVSASPTISTGSPQSTWVYTEGRAEIPTNANKARLVVRCNDHTSGDGRFMVDDVFMRNMSPGGSLFVDYNTESPAVVVKDHGAGNGKAAIFLYGVGDLAPDGDEDGEMDVAPWEWRYDIFDAVVKQYFGVSPQLEILGTNSHLAMVEYRNLSDGSTLWQVKNYLWNTNFPASYTNEGGGDPQTFTIQSDLLTGKTIRAFESGTIIEEDSDGTISLTLVPDGMEMLHVFDTGAVSQIVQIEDAPALVHPFGDKVFQVTVRYDCLDRSDLTLNLAFKEQGDNGDGVSNEVYQSLSTAVEDSGVYVFNVWIPNADLDDTDYISTADGGAYQFSAWLEDASSNRIETAVPQMVQLMWGVRPANALPSSMDKGDQVNVDIEWEELYEYLPWEATPLTRNDAYPGRVAIFRSLKTEDRYPGHLDTVNAVVDWLESMGYESGNYLDISFDNISVPGLFSDTFSDGNADGWTRAAGCANWDVDNGALRVNRIGNDDNIMVTGSAWTNYTVSIDITYNEQGHYLNNAEVYLRYVDRDNFVKVGIENFYGFWRLKRTVRVDADNARTTWLHDFPKTNSPTTNATYTLRVEATDDVFNVYFDDEYINSFTDTNFVSGCIGVGTKATQLGIWEPRQGYYFIDDDEYSYYAGVDASTTTGTPLNLDYGYLVGFFPTLILPSTYVMSDVEVSNVTTWIDSGLNSLIVIDGGVACEDETGTTDMGRIEDILGVSASLVSVTGLTTATVGGDGHYVSLDYEEGDTVTVSGDAVAYNTLLSGATDVLTLDNGSESIPGLILNKRTLDPDSPVKVVVFNFDVASGGQLTNTFSQLAQRAFEWARGEAYKVTLELNFDTQSTNAFDFTLLTTTGWLLTGSGTNTLIVDIPENNIMTGDNLYWVMYVHPWDSDDPWADHGGFYTSEDETGASVYTTLAGIGLQILGITDVAYAGRDWDKWIAYNTRTQDLVLVYGLKDKGQIQSQDNFDDGNYTGWTVTSDPNIAWSVTDQALRATVSGVGGDSYITLDGLSLNDTNITLEYDVLFQNGAASGGIIYRGAELEINPTRCGWVDDDPEYYTNSLPASGSWQHVVVTIRDGNPYPRCDVRVGTNIICISEDIEVTNFTSNTIGLVAPNSSGYAAWDNVRLVDEEYAVVWSTVNGISYPTNDVPTGTWPSVPDYDPNMIEHGGANEGSEYEWFINFKGEHDVYARQDVDIYFAPRLMVESSNFPTLMTRGETVQVPIEWEGIGTETVARLNLSLEDPYLGTNVARGTFEITNTTGSSSFELTIDSDATASKNYNWLAYLYPTNATNAMLQRIGLDDTFYFQPVPEGAPIKPETVVEVSSISDGDYVVYSDAGIPANSDIYTWSGGSATWDAEFTLWPAAEGSETFYTLCLYSYVGWGVFNTNGVDLSTYTNGYLKFSLWSFQSVNVEIEDMDGNKGSVSVGPTDTYWSHYSIPMTNFTAVDFSDIKGFFMVTSSGAAEYIVDQVRWSETDD